MSPTLETLTEVVRACGLDLVVHLEPHDDHDWTLVEAKQQLAPDQRLEDLESMVDLVNEGRAPSLPVPERWRAFDSGHPQPDWVAAIARSRLGR